MKAWVKNMSALAKDITFFNPKRKDLTNGQAMKSFYALMKKHGICQGTWGKNGSGRLCNNFEWTMCLVYFKHIHRGNNDLLDLFGGKVPKELLAYGRRPKISQPRKQSSKK